MPLHALLTPQFKAAGLQPLLDTSDFDAWVATVGASLGDHRSDLCSDPASFHTRMAYGQCEGLQLLHIQGHGEVHLDRVQGDTNAVLWLPLQGYSLERINGVSTMAEPGMALLLRPGDDIKGQTSRHLEGLSIVLPSQRLAAPLPRLLDGGAHNCALIAAARRFADGLAAGHGQGVVGAHALLDQLDHWQWSLLAQIDGQHQRVSAQRRRAYVGEAVAWMGDHLEQSFNVATVASAIHVSVRTLQYAFVEECGQSPMAVAKRLRLRRLRSLLQDLTSLGTIAELMASVGLLACGVTAADYRSYCGETPRQTRQGLRATGNQDQSNIEKLGP
jgi:AraC family ethanolamine operon transcriptional activator